MQHHAPARREICGYCARCGDRQDSGTYSFSSDEIGLSVLAVQFHHYGGVDLLFGLDMLKRHQAIIDLEKNALRIHGEEVRFLSEHELPEKARWEGENDATSPLEGGSAALGAVHPPGGLHPGVPPAGISAAVPGSASSAASTPAPAPTAKPTPPPAQARGYSEDKIKMLMDLGIPRAQALQALDAAGGDADVAASMLFQ
ncbi:hypothetical protein DFJ77DRAFT_95684 [Powellomyces hirtus]|nr:hypothetical protein DFJ77DRAFT_95684 [Powellomyces hirtus]